mgnify:CR=1 FL=1
MRTFRDALIENLELRGVSLKSVADATGVSYEQLKKLKQNKSTSTNVEDGLAVSAHFGMTVEEFIGGKALAEQAEIVRLLNQLSPAERAFLLNAAKAQIDARG